MYLEDETKIKKSSPIKISCDYCNSEQSMILKNAIINFTKNGNSHKCKSCKCKETLKPQNTKEYWTNKKESHSKKIKSSEKYYNAIKDRDTSGKNNGMYNKKHSDETKEKMSKSRTGKIGKDATAWKGGNQSVNKRVKRYLQRTHKWFSSVIRRDGKCMHCGSTKKLDAHHINPIANIIKEELSNSRNLPDDEKYLLLITKESILDKNLNNGITLCRTCHQKVHKNWGSHNPKV